MTRLASSVDSPRVNGAELNFDVSPRKTVARKKREEQSDADSGVASVVRGGLVVARSFAARRHNIFEDF